MKTIILIILSAISVSAQDIIISGTYNVLEIQKEKTYRVTGNSTIQNVNWNGKDATLLIDPGVTLTIQNSLNVNAFGTVVNKGSLLVGNWIDLNNIKEFTSTGIITAKGMQNNTNTVINLCGSLTVGSMQLNNAGINAPCCLLVTTGHLDVNSPNVFTGMVHVIIGTINLNHIFSNDSQVTYLFNGHVNQPQKWGAATYYNSQIPKCDGSLPVTIEYFKILDNKPSFRFIEVKDVDYIELQESTDMKEWKLIKKFDNVQPNKDYKP